MNLVVTRSPSSKGATIGTLSIDGVHECFTCEDEIREVPGVPVEHWKIQNKTAIPSGMYPVVIDFSTRFKKLMPHVLNVPGFSGIRIHPGNSSEDTDGCLLPGKIRFPSSVGQSVVAFEAVLLKLQTALTADDAVTIKYVNP